ncbi:hypothetical protein KKF59_01695 [Patescibacteria group bacterium]|nr:hypothetical protein [Patescibacteria group bacterium]MBU1034461.1 hypothetical protein [Patescibacteria group bacterium]MBU1629905.1 hypothetical protein [Patescibacteria group bacterium]MBU1907827.1 hypothetical protein [Patescibacteria group bacterium]
MEKPKSPENKDAEYFEKELLRLAQEAKKNGQKEIALILFTLLGALKGDNIDELKADCLAFSEKMMARMRKKDEKLN